MRYIGEQENQCFYRKIELPFLQKKSSIMTGKHSFTK